MSFRFVRSHLSSAFFPRTFLRCIPFSHFPVRKYFLYMTKLQRKSLINNYNFGYQGGDHTVEEFQSKGKMIRQLKFDKDFG